MWPTNLESVSFCCQEKLCQQESYDVIHNIKDGKNLNLSVYSSVLNGKIFLKIAARVNINNSNKLQIKKN